MAVIVPFSGIYYNPEKSNKISELVCPSTDFLDDERVLKLKENGNNFCNAIYSEGDGAGKYKISIHKLYGWLLRDILVVDKIPSLYINEQNVTLNGVEYKRYGLIGLLKIEDYDGNIKKQEKTIEKFRDDKYNLIKETQFNLEPVTGLIKDGTNSLGALLSSGRDGKTTLLIKFSDTDGNLNTIYRIDEPGYRDEIIKYFTGKSLYIIDDYRYEAALKYKKETASALKDRYTGKEPCNFVLVNIFNAYDKAMRFYPVNRLVRNIKVKPSDFIKSLSQKYKLSAIPFTDPNTEKQAEKKLRMILNDSFVRGNISYGIFMRALPDKHLILNMNMPVKEDVADSEILESVVFGPMLGINGPGYDTDVGYAYSDTEAFKAIRNGQYDAAFLTNGIDAFKLLELADRGKWMPYNSISIYPKVMSGSMSFSYRYSRLGL
jgi:uncharacterized protein (DUF1015 family)